MKKILLYIFFIVLLVNNSYGQIFTIKRNKVKAQNGVIDLRDKDFKHNVYSLEGEWEFFWHQMIAPEEIDYHSPTYALVPKFWTKYELDGKRLPSQGYATYRVKILLPENTDKIALSFHSIFTAYNLYINGKLVDRNGIAGTSEKTTKPSWQPKTNIFHTHSDTLDIVLQVSNFHHTRAGITKAVVLGTPESIYDYNLLGLGYEAFIIGALLIMALYHLFLFYHRKTDLSALYLAMTLITQSILTGLDGEYILVRLLPDLSWFFEVKLLYVLLYYRSVMFGFFVYYISKVFNIKILVLINIWGSLMTLLVLFTPPIIFTKTLTIFILGGFFIVSYTFYVMIRSIKYQIGTAYASIGTLTLLVTALNDTLYDTGNIQSFYMLGMGLFVFTLTQAMMLAIHSGRVHQHITLYSVQLKIMNRIKEELIKIPFYESAKSLKIITQIFKATRGIFIEQREGELILSGEVAYNEINEHNLSYEKVTDDFLCKEAVEYSISKQKTISVNKETKKKRKKRSSSSALSKCEYFKDKQIQSLLVAPVFQNQELKAILYFEKSYSVFPKIYVKILEASLGQIASLIANAESYRQLQTINNKLEELVAQRTKELNKQKDILLNKNLQLKEKVEELQAYTDKLNALNHQLHKHKDEIETKNSELEKIQTEILGQKKLVEEQYKKITDSILFAKKVQESILTNNFKFPFEEYFLLYLPKQIVSGDFYWFKTFGTKSIIVVADCTGHGVPGAFMSILGATFITDITQKYFIEYNDNNVKASTILEELRAMVINHLSEHGHDDIKDGMDVALAIYDQKDKTLNFAGAYNPLWLIRDDEFIELRADRQPIGMHYKGILKPFTDHFVQLEKGDWLYMFTDGYADQFNSEGVKFYRKRFKKLIIDIHKKTAHEQKEILLNEFTEWKKGYFQIDDVLILGLKV